MGRETHHLHMLYILYLVKRFRPALHVNYAETVLPVRDGLPKFKDFPAEHGGSGEQMPE